MRFGFHLFMVDPAEFLDIARTADEWGWDSIGLADAPFFPEVTIAPYPYTPDGSRFWPLDIPVLDPWVAITAMATVTKRIRFITSVLRMAIRKPLLEAKTVSSVAAISNDRVALGVGLAWMPEEFEWLHEDMKTRGARVNEAIQIIRLVLGGGMVEFHGKYYSFDRLTMAPTPKKRVPIYVGGTTKPALRRAARYGDGWNGTLHSMEEIKGIVADLSRQRREFGREKEPFDILLQCPEARTVDDIRRLEGLGVTDLQVTPWVVYGEPAEAGLAAMRQQPQLGVKLEAIKRYGEEIIAKFQ
jgi:probable F420-dependent oxidoreductase